MTRSASPRPPRRPSALPAPVLAVSLVALSLVLAACGASQSSTPTPGSPSAAASPTARASATPPATPSATPSTTPPPASLPPSPSGGGPSASPAGSPGPNAETYRTIESQVEAIRGLDAGSVVDPLVLDAAALKKELETRFRKDNPPEEVAASDRVLKAMGLIPADSSLERLYLDLATSSVAGFYDPDTKQMYVVSQAGDLGPTEKITYAHEFTHLLQDQTFGLKQFGLDDKGQGDRGLGRLSLAEGDATLLMSLWAQQALTPQELAKVATSTDPAQQAVLDRSPAILRETLLFPYTTGLNFVLGKYLSGQWDAVDGLYGRLPDSTEQILHPELYDASEKPTDVKLPADLAARMGSGWKVAQEDTFGEFQTRIWLELGDSDVATDAAEGWGGDRMALLEGPDGAWALVWKTAWDTPADATEFESAARQVVDARVADGVPSALAAGRGLIGFASSRAVLDKAMSAAGS